MGRLGWHVGWPWPARALSWRGPAPGKVRRGSKKGCESDECKDGEQGFKIVAHESEGLKAKPQSDCFSAIASVATTLAFSYASSGYAYVTAHAILVDLHGYEQQIAL